MYLDQRTRSGFETTPKPVPCVRTQEQTQGLRTKARHDATEAKRACSLFVSKAQNKIQPCFEHPGYERLFEHTY